MNKLLDTSMHQVFEDQFEIKLSSCKNRPKHPAYTAKIWYKSDSKEHIATIWIQKPTLKKLSNILLFEESPNEETLEDLTKEFANLIVGHAKMIAHNKGLEFEIKIPEYTGIATLEPKTDCLLFKADNRCIAIQSKEV